MARRVKQSRVLANLARERGFTVGPETTTAELHAMLGPTPPSAQHIEYIRILADFLGYDINLEFQTYSQARRAVDLLETAANEKVLLDTGWQTNDVLAWRDAYWLIVDVHAARFFYRLSIVQVVLGQQGDGVGVTERVSATKAHAPRTVLISKGFKVDMTTWPPPPPPPRPADDEIGHEEDDPSD